MRTGLLLAVLVAGAARAEPVVIIAGDGVAVHADFQGDVPGTRPLMILFHQAGSNRHEYDPVVPGLQALGCDTLAVDQRSGGGMWNAENQTVAALGKATGYGAAYPDFEAALAWGEAAGADTIVVMGSSYAASLVIELAANHPDTVDGVISFSPGEYFSTGRRIRDAAARLTVPVFVSQASTPGEVAAAADIVAEVPEGLATQFEARLAPHGASALRNDTNPEGEAEVWAAVTAFLAGIGQD